MATVFAKLLACALLICVLVGCRGRSYEDVYRQKLAGEIRVLEDQLYEADYQNRVLRDELNRLKESPSIESDRVIDERELPANPPYADPAIPMERPLIDSRQTSPLEDDEYDVLDLGDDMETPRELPRPPGEQPTTPSSDTPGETPEPLIDPAAPENTRPRNTNEPAAPSERSDGGLGMPTEVPAPTPDPTNSDGPGMGLPTLPIDESNQGGSPTELLPPPANSGGAELIPPGESQLRDPQIVPGDPKPPADSPKGPPGRIQIPKGSRTLQFEPLEPENSALSRSASSTASEPAIPTRIVLNESMSGTEVSEAATTEGLNLVVTANDKTGQLIPLENFDVDAELTIVVVDPADDSEDARVGRWDFTTEQVRQFVKATPVSGLHIPIRWQDRQPSSDNVLVYIRLSAAEEEMRCEGRVMMKPQVAMSTWLPR
ncbi:MAG: hypothetical protein AAFV88_20750 [Planctomycetota bacterium]